MHSHSRLLSILALASCLAAGCGIPADPAKSSPVDRTSRPQTERVVIPVEAQLPFRGSISEYLETVARVEAERRVDVSSKGTGLCLELLVDEGDTVKTGQPLAELDKKDIETQRRQSDLQVRQAKADFERAKRAFEYGFLSGMEYENARFALENALAGKELQEIQLENATIRAPIDGVVTRRNIHVGQLVTTGAPVFQIVDPTSYIINIDLAEKDLPRLRVGQKAKFMPLSLEGQEFEATVTRIGPSIDPSSGMVKVRLEMDSATREQLLEAAFVRVRLVMDTRENALLVPKDAVLEENTRRYVFVVSDQPSTPASTEEPAPDAAGADERRRVAEAAAGEEGASGSGEERDGRLYARRAPVEVGLEDSRHAEIMSGIDEHTLVITLGQKNLRTDSEVRVTTARAEMDAVAAMTAQDALDAAKIRHEEIKQRIEEEKREAARQLEAERRRRSAETGDASATDDEF